MYLLCLLYKSFSEAVLYIRGYKLYNSFGSKLCTGLAATVSCRCLNVVRES